MFLFNVVDYRMIRVEIIDRQFLFLRKKKTDKKKCLFTKKRNIKYTHEVLVGTKKKIDDIYNIRKKTIPERNFSCIIQLLKTLWQI